MDERRDGIIRPMAVLGFSVLGALTVCGLLGYSSAFFIFAVSLLTFLPTVFLKRIRKAQYLKAISLSIALASLLFLTVYTFSVQPVLELAGKSTRVSATVCDYPEEFRGKYFYKLKTKRVGIDGAPQSFRLHFSSKTDLGAEPGDTITFEPTFYSFTKREGEVSRQYARSTYLGCYALTGAEVTPAGKRPLLYPVYRLRRNMKQRLEESTAGTSGSLLSAMLLGDQGRLEEEQVEHYRKAGVAHLFAVSGLHLSIWRAFLQYLLRACGVRPKLRTALAMGGVLFYMALTGFSFSVLRAGIMLLLYDTSRLIRRDADSINSLGIAVFLLGCTMPFVGMDEGLLLSFSATLGILVLGTYWNGKIASFPFGRLFLWERKLLKGLLASLSISVSAALFTFPVQVLFFESVSLYSPISNLLVVFPATIFLVLGGVLLYLSFVPGMSTIAYWVLKGTTPIAGYMDAVTAFLSGLPGAAVPVHTIPVLLWTLLTILLFLTAYLLRKKRKLYAAAAVLSAVGLIITSMIQTYDQGKSKVILCDVGKGTAVLLVKGGQGALIGGGGADNAADRILNQMEKQGVRSLDMVLLPRTTKAESSAWEELASQTRISSVRLPPLGKDDLFLIPSGTQVTQGKQASLSLWDTFLVEQQDTCIYITAPGLRLLLLTKAAISAQEIPEEWRQADILLSKEIPKYAFTVCHPKQFILSSSQFIDTDYRWEQGECPVLSTGGQGAIELLPDEPSYHIRREWN